MLPQSNVETLAGRSVFFTGGTGFVGRRLVERLAEQGCTVQLLVRRNSRRAARNWLGELGKHDGAAAGRITLVTGDLTAPGIVDERDLARVLEDSDSIFHCAAATEPGLDRAYAWAHNVEGTRAVLDLARKHPDLKRLVHFSDVAVAGDRRGVFFEGELLAGQDFSEPYSESKLFAERRVRAASEELPITVLRPGRIVGDRRTGEVDRVRGVYHLLVLLARLAALPLPFRGIPVAPLGSCARVELVPVDWVVEAAVELWKQPSAVGGTFHLVDPDAPTVREFLDLVCAELGLGAPAVDVPRRLWHSPGGELLRRGLERGLGLRLREIESAASCAIPDTSGASRLLRPLSLEAPSLRSYLGPVLEYVRTQLV